MKKMSAIIVMLMSIGLVFAGAAFAGGSGDEAVGWTWGNNDFNQYIKNSSATWPKGDFVSSGGGQYLTMNAGFGVDNGSGSYFSETIQAQASQVAIPIYGGQSHVATDAIQRGMLDLSGTSGEGWVTGENQYDQSLKATRDFSTSSKGDYHKQSNMMAIEGHQTLDMWGAIGVTGGDKAGYNSVVIQKIDHVQVLDIPGGVGSTFSTSIQRGELNLNINP